MTPAEQSQKQAEQAMDGFIFWSKRVTLWSAFFLCVVVFACNNGVETGINKTGSGYNGSQYNPSNLSVK
jgi:SNF family Na+-dependent transporter